jgi:hypothetical protein
MNYKVTHYKILLDEIDNKCIESNVVDLTLNKDDLIRYREELKNKYNDKKVNIYFIYKEIPEDEK